MFYFSYSVKSVVNSLLLKGNKQNGPTLSQYSSRSLYRYLRIRKISVLIFLRVISNSSKKTFLFFFLKETASELLFKLLKCFWALSY